jgi:MFS family permease
LVATSFTGSLAAAALVAPFVFFGNVLTVPAINAAIMDLAPFRYRGTLIGLSVAVSGLGLAIGPILGGLILETGSAAIGLRVAAVGAVIVGVMVALRRSAFEHHEAEPPD